ncbi:MAG: outer membrane protein assembly factor BamA, partial [Deltaproteobacteria bacterium]
MLAGEFNNVRERSAQEKATKGILKWPFYRLSCIGLVLVLSWLVLISRGVEAGRDDRVAVLPFSIYGPRPVAGLKTSLQEMLSKCLAEMDLPVMDTSVINQRILGGVPPAQVQGLGKELGVRWIVRGSATQIGPKISIDINILDVSGERGPFYLYMVAEDVDKLGNVIRGVAKSIRNVITGYVQVYAVKVVGNRRIESDAILAVINTKKGDVLDYDQLDQDLRSVYKMGFFKDVKIETEDAPTGKTVVFHVTEKPSIGRIVFKGNKHVDKDDLKKEIGISLYSIYNPYEVKQSVNRLKDYYRQKGYYGVEILSSVEPLPNNEVLLRYDIHENEKVYVKKIEFVGNKRFSDDDLKDLMKTQEKGIFSWITKSGYLDKKKLEFDIQKINAFYHNRGFIKAKIGSPKITYRKGEGLFITIEVHEGAQYKVGRVSIEGDLIKKEDELLKEVKISQEKFFNRKTVRKDVLRLKNLYSEEGYAYVEVKPRVNENEKPHTVDLTYKISKGPKVKFERINIAGNTVTRDKVIRRELKVAEGDYFNGKALRKSMWNLNRLGYFENVDIKPHKGSGED